jgi:hypothetical protein
MEHFRCCKRRTCELLYQVSCAFLSLAPKYAVTYPPFNAADIKDPVFAALPPFLSLVHSFYLSILHSSPPPFFLSRPHRCLRIGFQPDALPLSF